MLNKTLSIVNHDLTLLVTLKDRFEFTRRMCRYFSDIQYPFHVIFADGSLEDTTEDFFASLSDPGFSYEYIRYPKDDTLGQFYKKSASAAQKVKTPYVMLADNDDFPIPAGQLEAIAFLKKHPTYVGCNGRVVGMVLDTRDKPYGTQGFFIPYYCKVMDFPTALDQKDGTERIINYCKDFYSIYYAVFRRESLVATFAHIARMKFETLHVYEIFLSSMQLAQGKVHSINALTYVRQKGSSHAAASCQGLFFDIFYGNMVADLKKAFDCVAQHISKREKEKVFSEIYDAYYQKINTNYVVIGFYLLKRMIKLFNKRSIIIFFLQNLAKINLKLTTWASVRLLTDIAAPRDLITIKNLATKHNEE